MINDLSPYSVMKDSGVPWLGEVPEHWDVRRGKWLFHHRKQINGGRASSNVLSLTLRGVVNNDPDNPEGLVPKDYATYQLFRKGDLVFKLIDLENLRTSRVGLVHEDGIMSSAYLRLIPQSVGEIRFFFQQYFDLYQRGIYNQLGAGVRSTLGPSDLLDLSVVVPPLSEQAAIVRYLDHADRRIRRYIRAKQKLIKLLEEQKQTIIHRAVTRGLDRNVRLKPSGVEWLGDVPEHWEVQRLKWATRLQRGYDLPAEQRIPGPFPVVSSGGIIDTHSEARSTGPGVVMGRYGSTDAVFFVEPDFWPHNTALFVTDFQGNRPHWCYFMLRTISKSDHSGKSAVPGVDRKDLFEIKVAVPPVREQDAIVWRIENALEGLEGAAAAAQREISLLREYRTRLIADVVTGKLDVREAAARLPDEAEEPEPLDGAHALPDTDEDAADDLDAVPEEAEV